MVSENRKNTKPYKCPFTGFSKVAEFKFNTKKKKRIVFVHTSYTQKMKFYNNAIYSHFTNMKYLGEKIINGCERPAY